jgi:hypothetical protein
LAALSPSVDYASVSRSQKSWRSDVSFVSLRHAAVVALSAFFIIGAASSARADIRDYEFRLIEREVRKKDSIVSVRLIRKTDGKTVADAVIFARRLDMAPEGMESMTAAMEPMPSKEPGVYRFKVNLSMEGDWRLSLAAKIQGEMGTVESRLILKALP